MVTSERSGEERVKKAPPRPERGGIRRGHLVAMAAVACVLVFALWLISGDHVFGPSPEDILTANSAFEDGDEEATNSIGMKLRLIQPGTFMMGQEGVMPVHQVTITSAFYIGVFEVTQEQYRKVMGTNPSASKGSGRRPVETVRWFDAQEFCRKLSELEDATYRLPTEAEWEYACRAGSTGTFCFGDAEETLGDYAWYGGPIGGTPNEVGGKKPNAWGLYDMHGNVWEWCSDGYARQSGVMTPSTNPGQISFRGFRGGGWASPASDCASAYCNANSPLLDMFNTGFRVVRSLP